MKKVMMAVSLLFLLGGCQSAPSQPETETQDETVTETDTENDTVNETETGMEENEISEVSEKEEMTMILKINDQKIDVNWEDNESVTALEQLVSDKALTISMSMYGGWEQVGSIGRSLPRNDVQTTAVPGDIMLYSGNQIVLFYGNNSWAYTKLGSMQASQDELRELLGNGDVTVESSME
jgi:hypothetical protein